jgi:hypothetical protein
VGRREKYAVFGDRSCEERRGESREEVELDVILYGGRLPEHLPVLLSPAIFTAVLVCFTESIDADVSSQVFFSHKRLQDPLRPHHFTLRSAHWATITHFRLATSLGPLLDVIVHKLQELKHGCYLVSKSGIVNAMSSWSLLTIVPPYRDTHRPLPEPELLQLLIRICHCQVIGIGSRHRYWVETWAVTLLGIRQLLGDQILQVFQTLVDGCLVSADGK